MNEFSGIDYLLIGHVTLDLISGGHLPGGTAVYSTLTAQALGCRTALLTSASPDYDLDRLLPGISIRSLAAENTTTFKNIYTESGRQQTIHAVAGTLSAEDVPAEWERAAIVHLGPVANEIDPSVAGLFSNSLVGLTPQGWFRRWRADGRIFTADWPDADRVLPRSAAAVVSLEDLPVSSWLNRIRQLVPVVVLTQGSEGCTVFCHDETRQFKAPAAPEINPTGAGDIFATAFLVRLHQTKGNPWEAAQFANRIAATSVAQDTLEAKLQSIKEFIEDEKRF